MVSPSIAGAEARLNGNGPVDHDVPVLKIASPDGKLRAVLFGYACHNTTLKDGYQINGDYAGFAQIELEKALPGATAMFLMLCGGDQNPNPRGTVELAAQHGKTLAGEVQRVLAGTLRPVRPTIRTAYEEVKLDFVRRDRAVFEQEAKSDDRFRRHRAEAMLAALDAGRPVWQVAVPVQVIGFGEKLAMVALGGEVVVDYSLRLKREYPHTDLIVAGYTNDVMCYIPSRRVLREGGYEADESMIYYGQPGPFAESVEETLIGACHRLLAKRRREAGPQKRRTEIEHLMFQDDKETEMNDLVEPSAILWRPPRRPGLAWPSGGMAAAPADKPALLGGKPTRSKPFPSWPIESTPGGEGAAGHAPQRQVVPRRRPAGRPRSKRPTPG